MSPFFCLCICLYRRIPVCYNFYKFDVSHSGSVPIPDSVPVYVLNRFRKLPFIKLIMFYLVVVELYGVILINGLIVMDLWIFVIYILVKFFFAGF